MAENFPGIGPDFSSLAEITPPSPEKKNKKKEKKEAKKSVFESAKEPEKDAEKLKDDKPEKKEPTEKEAPLETMGKEEEKLAAGEIGKELIQERKEEVESAQDGSIEEKVALVGATFDETFVEEIGSGKDVDAALANAEARTFEATGIEVTDVEEENPIKDEPEATTAEETIVSPEAATETDESEDSAAILPSPSTTSGSGSSSTPPPAPPGGGIGGLPPMGPGSPGGSGGAGPNTLAYTPNTVVNQPLEYINVRRSNRRHLLVGGLVGYMVGRRRGRIKTERRLMPIQQKLEKEVKSLEQKIITREEKIRNITREQLTQKPEIQRQLERLQASRERKAGVGLERNKIPHKEKIGRFALAGEQPLTIERESQLRRMEKFDTVNPNEQSRGLEHLKLPEKPKTVELMTLPELLLIAEHVEIEQSSVRKLYETSRLDDEGLRRVVRAYLRGERYEHVLRDYLITPEKFNFAETLQRTTPGGTSAQPIHGSGSSDVPTDGETPNTGSRQSYADAFHKEAAVTKQKKSKTGLITASVVTAVALILYLVMQ